MRPPAAMFGPSATIATSAISSPYKTRSRRESPGSSSPHWPTPSSGACCASCRNGSMPGKPISAASGTSKYTPEENKTALTFFRQAIVLEPNFAPGHYGYALALQWEIWHFSTRSFMEVQGTAREEAHIAVSLDD